MSTYPIFRTKHRSRKVSENIERDRGRSLYFVYSSQFVEYQMTIEKARKIFSQEQIWPDQCEYILHRMSPLQKTAKSLANLASREQRQTNKNQGYSHYSIVVTTHCFCDQIDNLLSVIREYKGSESNKDTQKMKQKAIVNHLKNVDSSLQDLMQELNKTI